ncbi:MAG: hypothetical protein LBB76_05460 [Azoarcus sp.]|nr:hypothetical protein [Azoarcus sp.]
MWTKIGRLLSAMVVFLFAQSLLAEEIPPAPAQTVDETSLQTETFQINYHRVADVVKLLQTREPPIFSERASVTFDERRNQISITDAGASLAAARQLIAEIDIAPRMIRMEFRTIKTDKALLHGIGEKLRGESLKTENTPNSSADDDFAMKTDDSPRSLRSLRSPNSLNPMIFKSEQTSFLNAEVDKQAMDGEVRIVSTTRIMTANQVDVLVQYRVDDECETRARPEINITPEITQDDHLWLTISTARRISKPSPEAKVWVENGGTVMIDAADCAETGKPQGVGHIILVTSWILSERD